MDNSFEYTYSAKQREEIEKIRQKYLPKEETKLEQLRRLDESVTRKGTVISLIIGVISALIMGAGMSCCLVWTGTLLIPGIIIGTVGIVGIAMSYPVYERITAKERQRLAPEILRLADELMQ